MRQRLLVAFAFAPHLLLGCIPEEEPCTPVAMSDAVSFEGREASYPVPRHSPAGQVSVAAQGLGGRVVRVRMNVSNYSADRWTVYPDEQRIEVDDVSVNAKISPSVSIVPGQTRTVTLVFTVPANIALERAPAAMEAIWTVHAGSHVAVERTPFERVGVREW